MPLPYHDEADACNSRLVVLVAWRLRVHKSATTSSLRWDNFPIIWNWDTEDLKKPRRPVGVIATARLPLTRSIQPSSKHRPATAARPYLQGVVAAHSNPGMAGKIDAVGLP